MTGPVWHYPGSRTIVRSGEIAYLACPDCSAGLTSCEAFTTKAGEVHYRMRPCSHICVRGPATVSVIRPDEPKYDQVASEVLSALDTADLNDAVAAGKIDLTTTSVVLPPRRVLRR